MWEIVDRELYAKLPVRKELKEFLSSDKLRNIRDCYVGQRPQVVDAIYKDHLTEKQKANLEVLKEGNCQVVTVSHQPNLLGGPVFVLYKALHAIVLAEEIHRITDVPTIPVFWVHADDHDWKELTTVYVKGVKFSGFEDRQEPFGMSRIDDDVLKYVKDILKGVRQSKLFLEFYDSSETLSEAFIRLMSHFVGHTGILFLDSGNTYVRRRVKQFVKADLLENKIFPVVEEIVSKWQSQGKKPIINPMPTNTFFITDSGKRVKVIRREEGFDIAGETWTLAELERRLENEPERFSPGVAVRILWQEDVMRSCAFTGGSTEILYWYQLLPLFSLMNINVPALFLRHSLFILDGMEAQVVSQYGGLIKWLLRWEDLQSVLLSMVLPEWFQEQNLLGKCEDLLKDVDTIPREDVRSFLASRLRKLFKQWKKEVKRARKMIIGSKMEQLKRVHEDLMPNGIWQERVMSLVDFVDIYGKIGVDKLVEIYPRDKEPAVFLISPKIRTA